MQCAGTPHTRIWFSCPCSPISLTWCISLNMEKNVKPEKKTWQTHHTNVANMHKQQQTNKMKVRSKKVWARAWCPATNPIWTLGRKETAACVCGAVCAHSTHKFPYLITHIDWQDQFYSSLVQSAAFCPPLARQNDRDQIKSQICAFQSVSECVRVLCISCHIWNTFSLCWKCEHAWCTHYVLPANHGNGNNNKKNFTLFWCIICCRCRCRCCRVFHSSHRLLLFSIPNATTANASRTLRNGTHMLMHNPLASKTKVMHNSLLWFLFHLPCCTCTNVS